MTFKVRGKQVTQTGAIFTVALRKLAEGWRIAAWAWQKALLGSDMLERHSQDSTVSGGGSGFGR